MKPTGVFISLGRGTCVDEVAFVNVFKTSQTSWDGVSVCGEGGVLVVCLCLESMLMDSGRLSFRGRRRSQII